MPNRVFRGSLVRSRRWAAANFDAKAMWVLICLVADDYGRFDADPVILRAACFPRSLEEVAESDIARWLEELGRVRLLALYQAGPDRLLQLFNFGQRVRAKSKYPAPPVELLDRLEEPKDSVARSDVGQMTVIRPSDDRHVTAVVVGGVVDVVEDGVVGGDGGGAHRAPAPFPVPGLRAVEEPMALLERPPQPARPPAYVLSCQDCVVMLRTLNELTGRLYNAPGRAGEWMHMAHAQQGLDKALQTIRSKVDSIGQRPGKTRFLAPKIMFEPGNWDVDLNALDGGGADRDALPKLRL